MIFLLFSLTSLVAACICLKCASISQEREGSQILPQKPPSRSVACEVVIHEDLHEEKDYLKGQSIEKIIHGWKSTKDKDLPVFKHLTTRWSMKDQQKEYENQYSTYLFLPCFRVCRQRSSQGSEVLRLNRSNFTKYHDNIKY